MKKVILLLLFIPSLYAQQIEIAIEGNDVQKMGFGIDLSIPLIYKGLSQLVIGNRIYTTTQTDFYKKSTWNVGHRLELQKDKYTSSIGLYSGFEYFPSRNIDNLNEIRHNIIPLAYIEYTFSKGSKFPKNKLGIKTYIGGSTNEVRLGIKIVYNLRIKYLAYY